MVSKMGTRVVIVLREDNIMENEHMYTLFSVISFYSKTELTGTYKLSILKEKK
jgi:hypothetical protein